jgi:hypothetical protein
VIEGAGVISALSLLVASRDEVCGRKFLPSDGKRHAPNRALVATLLSHRKAIEQHECCRMLLIDPVKQVAARRHSIIARR